MSRGADKTGRSKKMGRFTPMLHETLDSPAFKSLTPLAQCLYWRLRRLAGHDGARNGEAFYSTRDAADDHDSHQDTVRRAFYLLQARGFIVPTQIGSLGVRGEGKATLWRLTELPTKTNPSPSREFLAWEPGHEFPVQKGRAPANAKQNPALRARAACPNGAGVRRRVGGRARGACPNGAGVGAVIEPLPALSSRAYPDLPGGAGE